MITPIFFFKCKTRCNTTLKNGAQRKNFLTLHFVNYTKIFCWYRSIPFLLNVTGLLDKNMHRGVRLDSQQRKL